MSERDSRATFGWALLTTKEKITVKIAEMLENNQLKSPDIKPWDARTLNLFIHDTVRGQFPVIDNKADPGIEVLILNIEGYLQLWTSRTARIQREEYLLTQAYKADNQADIDAHRRNLDSLTGEPDWDANEQERDK